MTIANPFYRTVRAMKPSSNSGYSGWRYIQDPQYAQNPVSYIRAYELIQRDLEQVFEFVEPSDENLNTFSLRIHGLLVRTCIEIEANFKAILQANDFPKVNSKNLNIVDYAKIDFSHHLSAYRVLLPTWRGSGREFAPFEPWQNWRSGAVKRSPLKWYVAYNNSKHNRSEALHEARFEVLVEAVAALLVLISAQFQSQSFSAGASALLLSGYEIYPYEAAIGELFRVKYPEDWTEDQLYDFDWKDLELEKTRFQKFDYSKIR